MQFYGREHFEAYRADPYELHEDLWWNYSPEEEESTCEGVQPVQVLPRKCGSPSEESTVAPGGREFTNASTAELSEPAEPNEMVFAGWSNGRQGAQNTEPSPSTL